MMMVMMMSSPRRSRRSHRTCNSLSLSLLHQDSVRVFEYMDGVTLSLFYYAGQWRVSSPGVCNIYIYVAKPVSLWLPLSGPMVGLRF